MAAQVSARYWQKGVMAQKNVVVRRGGQSSGRRVKWCEVTEEEMGDAEVSVAKAAIRCDAVCSQYCRAGRCGRTSERQAWRAKPNAKV